MSYLFDSCRSHSGFVKHFEDGIQSSNLSSDEMSYIVHRYVPLVEEATGEACARSWQYHSLINAITAAGVLIVILTPLTTSTEVTEASKKGLYWTIMVLGAISIIANKWLYLFSIYKKYTLCQQSMERYEAEGWHFIAGVGKYNRPRAERFKVFCDRVEKIQVRKVQEMVLASSSAAGISGQNGSPRTDDAMSVTSAPTPRAPTSRINVPLVSVGPYDQPIDTIQPVHRAPFVRPVRLSPKTQLDADLQEDNVDRPTKVRLTPLHQTQSGSSPKVSSAIVS